MLDVKIESSWKDILADEFNKKSFFDLVDFVKKEYKTKTIYPKANNIFRAFDLCPFDKIKVVILGQDPYHGYNQANGLCFSVNKNVPAPPSLRNIFMELEDDLNIKSNCNDLERWANQGIFLINSTLTVEAGKAGSHQNKGWEVFTDRVIEIISDKKENIVFILWGRFAQEKQRFIDQSKHLILKSAHPSPFSANKGFLGNKHFSKTNLYLKQKNKPIINW